MPSIPTPSSFPRAHRPAVAAARHVVVSGHYWASQAGFQVMEAGGNAVDAGVATGLAINVLESQYTGLAGVAPIMIYMAETDEIVTLGGVGPWPKAATCEYFIERHGGRIPEGHLNTVVPSAAGIWLTALERYGTMSFAEVAASAIRFARDGFPVYPFFARIIREREATLRGWPSSAEVYLPGGRLPDVGERFVLADLARTIQYMADEEAAAAKKGREAGIRAAYDAFYLGDIAQSIVRDQEANGGLLTAADMADYRPHVETPAHITFGDLDVYACGPWCQGPMVLEALKVLEGFDLASLGHNAVPYVHTVVEALKLAAADREVYFGDPDFVDVPLDALLSEDYAKRRAEMIRAGEAWAEMPPPGEVAGRPRPRWEPDPTSLAEAEAPQANLATSYLCAVDSHGNAFSATPSDGTLGAPVVPGTGIVGSQWGSRGYTNPDHPAAVGPGRRPRMSSNPAIAIRKGETVMPFGSPGSEVIAQAMVQAFLNVAVFGMDPQQAVEAPRFASYSWPASVVPHDYKPGVLRIEEPIGAEAADRLAGLGHKVTLWPEREVAAGSVCMIRADLRTGYKVGGADPRRTAYAVGW